MDGMPMGEPLGDKNAGGSSGGKRRAATRSSGIIARERGTRDLQRDAKDPTEPRVARAFQARCRARRARRRPSPENPTVASLRENTSNPSVRCRRKRARRGGPNAALPARSRCDR